MKKSSLSVAPYLHYIARLLHTQEVRGSSPRVSTKKELSLKRQLFCYARFQSTAWQIPEPFPRFTASYQIIHDL